MTVNFTTNYFQIKTPTPTTGTQGVGVYTTVNSTFSMTQNNSEEPVVYTVEQKPKESGFRDMPGYFIYTDAGRANKIAQDANRIEDEAQRQQYIREQIARSQTEEDERMLSKIHNNLSDPDAVYSMGELAKSSESAATIVAVESTQVRESIQAKVVRATQNLKFGEEFQAKIDKIITDNLGNYAKTKQNEVHEILLESYIEETRTNAAGSIYKLDEENRENAINAVKATGDKNLISAIVSTPPVNKEIKTEPSNEVTNKNTDATYELQQAIANNDEAGIKRCLDSMAPSDIIYLIHKDNSYVNTILASNPSIGVLNEINKFINNTNKVDYKIASKEIGFLGLTAQTTMIKQAAANNDLGAINRTFLNLCAKREYDKYEAQLKFA